MIDCEEGPLDLQYIASEEEFKMKYSSSSKTESYKMALWLLDMGFALDVQRIRGYNNRSSLLLTNKGEVSCPKYDFLENYNEDFYGVAYEDVKKLGLKTYGQTITIPKKGWDPDNDYLAFTIATDNFRAGNMITWRGIVSDKYKGHADDFFAANSVGGYLYLKMDSDEDYEDPKKVSEKLYDLLCASCGFMRDVTKTFNVDTETWEYEVGKVRENEDGSCSFDIYTLQPKMYISSFFDVKECRNLNYDMLCRTIIRDWSFVAYSKYDTCTSNIELRITPLGLRYIDKQQYRVFVLNIKRYGDDGLVLKEEQYTINEGKYGDPTNKDNLEKTIQYYSDLINSSSDIVEVTFKDFDFVPSKTITYSFGREVEFKPVEEEELMKVVDNIGAGEVRLSSGLVVDSGFNSKKFIEGLQNVLTNTNFLLTTYNDDTDYNLDCEIFFNGTIDRNGDKFPSYMTLLYKLSQEKMYEGYINLPITYTKEETTNIHKYQIAELDVNNYGIKLENPLCYFNGSEISVEGALKIILTLSLILSELRSDPVQDTAGVNAIISAAQRTVGSYLGGDTQLITERAEVIDRTCYLEFSAEVNFSYSKVFSMAIDLTVI
jgi:hypothetical protein